jgi:hypothetical protein
MAEEEERDELFMKICEEVILLYVRSQLRGTKDPRSPDKPRTAQESK